MAARKRMFHIGVLGTDSFLDMPHSSQCLYIQCGMRADDDGFVDDMKQILKVTNTTVDDISILCIKGYLFELCTKNLHKVYLIAHWNLCNSVRKDCYMCSSHNYLLENFELQSNKIYVKSSAQQGLFAQNDNAQNFVQSYETVTQIRQDKIRIDKNMLKSLFAQFWDIYPKKINKKRAEQEWMKLDITEEMFKTIMNHLRERIETTWVKDNKAYVVYPERFIKNEKWEDDLSEYQPLEQEEEQLADLSHK